MDSSAFWLLFIIFGYWLWLILFVGPALLGIFIFKQRPIRLKHKDSGITQTARLGWSWTYLYFGFLVPVFRGEILIGVFHFILSLVTFGLFQIIWSFLYNKQHITRLMTSGWILSDSPDVEEYAREKLQII